MKLIFCFLLIFFSETAFCIDQAYYQVEIKNEKNQSIGSGYIRYFFNSKSSVNTVKFYFNISVMGVSYSVVGVEKTDSDFIISSFQMDTYIKNKLVSKSVGILENKKFNVKVTGNSAKKYDLSAVPTFFIGQKLKSGTKKNYKIFIENISSVEDVNIVFLPSEKDKVKVKIKNSIGENLNTYSKDYEIQKQEVLANNMRITYNFFRYDLKKHPKNPMEKFFTNE